MGIRMFLTTQTILVPIGALIVGGLLGHLMGIHFGIEALGNTFEQKFSSTKDSTFQQAFVVPSILFCVGPMTLLGCLEDGLSKRYQLLGLKSLLDGISSIFFAATLGAGVLLSAGTVFVVQAPLTLGAKKLRVLSERKELLDETTSAGGLILIPIGLGLLGLIQLPTADFIPALAIAPFVMWIRSKISGG